MRINNGVTNSSRELSRGYFVTIMQDKIATFPEIETFSLNYVNLIPASFSC